MIKIWSANASSDHPGELERRCESWLTAEEVERADRFRVLTARNQHVVGRGMARKLLADSAAAAISGTSSVSGEYESDRAPRVTFLPNEIVFSFTQYGKPFVIAPEPFIRPFNVAHTDGMVLFAGGHGGSIGVDVERISRRTDVALAERYFAKPEVAYVMDHHDADTKLRAFLRVWTLKESFIKAIGTGLSMPLADFAFEDIDDERPKVRMLNPSLEDGRQWHFMTFSPGDGYIAALAIGDAGEQAEPEIGLQRFESLLSIV
jgi:4'-phosphopantetheinyl transferase